jgi:hypothetical protein
MVGNVAVGAGLGPAHNSRAFSRLIASRPKDVENIDARTDLQLWPAVTHFLVRKLLNLLTCFRFYRIGYFLSY